MYRLCYKKILHKSFMQIYQGDLLMRASSWIDILNAQLVNVVGGFIHLRLVCFSQFLDNNKNELSEFNFFPWIKHLSQLMRLWYLSHRRTAKAQASLRIHAVLPEPSLFAHMKYGSRQRVRPKIRHLTPLDAIVSWAGSFKKIKLKFPFIIQKYWGKRVC